jgi:hypothetical protein
VISAWWLIGAFVFGVCISWFPLSLIVSAVRGDLEIEIAQLKRRLWYQYLRAGCEDVALSLVDSQFTDAEIERYEIERNEFRGLYS